MSSPLVPPKWRRTSFVCKGMLEKKCGRFSWLASHRNIYDHLSHELLLIKFSFRARKIYIPSSCDPAWSGKELRYFLLTIHTNHAYQLSRAPGKRTRSEEVARTETLQPFTNRDPNRNKKLYDSTSNGTGQ